MMRRELLSLLVAMLGAGACGGQSDVKGEVHQNPSNIPDAGGSGGSGGEPGPSDGLSCDITSAPCGGDVVGVWKVMDCPLQLTGEVDVRTLALGCAYGETISGSLEVSGTLTLDAMGLLHDATTTKGVHAFSLPASCMDIPLVTGCESIGRPLANLYETAECVDDPETDGCLCSGTIDQRGGLGNVSISASTMSRYSLAGTRLTLGAGDFGTTYEYCVMNDAMVLTVPASSIAGQVVGSIVLQKE